MADYFEIDFLDVESKKSGDAIGIRYRLGDRTFIHVTDGGYLETGARLAEHIRKYYGNPGRIDHVVVTHPDGDHAKGLGHILEEFEIGQLWMLRPWQHAAELIDRFETYNSVDRLRSRLRSIYSNLADLEDIAIRKKIPIRDPFQGARIGEFTVLAPTKARYLDLIVESERTPEAAEARGDIIDEVAHGITIMAKAVIGFVRSLWGEEVFSPEETSAENEMSVVQYANLCGKKILLTGDVGRAGLTEAADYAPLVGLQLPGLDKFQVPHHGSRRNVSTAVLDRWLGERLGSKPEKATWTAYISSAKADEDHPRKSVVRAMIHRGATVYTTEGAALHTYHGDVPDRGWTLAKPLDYPEDQEE